MNRIAWADGEATVLEQHLQPGECSATPAVHYLQFVLASSGGRHRCAWNGEDGFDGSYVSGLVNVTPAGRTLEIDCAVTYRRVLALKIAPDVLLRTGDSSSSPPRPMIVAADALTWHLATALTRVCESGHSGKLYAGSLGLSLLTHVTRGQPLDGAEPVSGPRLTASKRKRIFDFMLDHLAEQIDVAELASLAGMSRTQFFNAFRSRVARLRPDVLC